MASGQDLWRSLKPFQDKSSEYLDAVASYLPQVERLNNMHKSNLSVFKSAELETLFCRSEKNNRLMIVLGLNWRKLRLLSFVQQSVNA